MSDEEARRRATEIYLHDQIPLARAMGIRLERTTGEQLILSAPLALNHNHLGTAFGGSLSAIATLAGYALLWLELAERTAHVVIRESRIDYRRPVRGEIRAVCERPSWAVLAGFRARFAKKGKARLRLEVRIEEAGETAVLFEGVFVAMS